MSSKVHEPEIISREELKTDAKFLKLERINWRDQDGKEVCHVKRCIPRCSCGIEEMGSSESSDSIEGGGRLCVLAPAKSYQS
jgi:hypothetical protein